MNQANLTARLLGYLRHLMNADPVVRKAQLRGPDHVQVSSETRDGELVTFLQAESPGTLPPLRVPVALLAEDNPLGYDGVRQCVYGWLEANKQAARRPVPRKSAKDSRLSVSRLPGS